MAGVDHVEPPTERPRPPPALPLGLAGAGRDGLVGIAADDGVGELVDADEDVVNPLAPVHFIGQRIRQGRAAAGLTQEALAGKCGVSRAAVAQWEGDITRPSLDHLQMAAETLGVWLSWLTSGDDAPPSHQPPFSPAQPDRRRVPVIDFVHAGKWDQIGDPYEPGGGMDFIGTDLALGPRAFALVIRGESMLPEFHEGDKIVIDPEIAPQPGDLVIAKLDVDDEATFKKYRPRGVDSTGAPVIELVPLNDDWPTLTITADKPGRILGTMVEHRRYRRRASLV